MPSRLYAVLVPVLILVSLGLLWLAWNQPSGTKERSVTVSPTAETVRTAREVTRIVPWPVTVEVPVLVTETVPAFQRTATVEALSPQPTRQPTRTPRATATPTLTGFGTDQQRVRVGDG